MSHTDGYERMREALSELQRAVEHMKEAFGRYDEQLKDEISRK